MRLSSKSNLKSKSKYVYVSDEIMLEINKDYQKIIDSGDPNDDEFFMNFKNDDMELEKLKIKLSETQKLKRGDIIYIDGICSGYKNLGKLIFDGINIVGLEYNLDKYGCIPEGFNVISEFPIRYWEGLIYYNNFIPFDISVIEDQIHTKNVIIRYNEPSESESFILLNTI